MWSHGTDYSNSHRINVFISISIVDTKLLLLLLSIEFYRNTSSMLSLYKFFISSYKFRIYKQRMTVISIQPLQTDPTMSDTWPYFLSVSRKLALLSTKTRSRYRYTVVAISTSIIHVVDIDTG